MDVSLPSYEAAMRDAREYLRRRDLSSQDEVPLYFAWERLYAAANANLSTDFCQETSEERRARQQARLAPRRGLPPPLFTSFDKVNRRSARASAFLRSDTSADVAIEMMARRYRREAEMLRSSREKLAMRSLAGAGKRLKKEKRRQKSPELEVEELLEAFEHSKVLPEDEARSSAMKRGKFDVASNKTDQLQVNVSAAKAAELRKSSFSEQNPATTASLSNVASVAAFAARVADWRMPSNIDAMSPPSKLLKKKGMSTSAKRLGEANESRGSAPVEDGEGDMTFDTSLGSSGFEDGSFESEPTGSSSASQMSRRRTNRGEAVEGKAEVSQKQKDVKRGASGKRLGNPSTAAVDTDTNSTTVQQVLAEDCDALANPSEFQQKLVQLSHAVGDMQVKIQGKQIEVTFKGTLGDTSNADAKDGEPLASATSSTESTQPSVTQKVFDTAGSRNDEDDGVEGQEGSAQQGVETSIPAKQSANLSQKQSSVRFADMEPRNRDGEDDRLSDHESNRQASEQLEPRSAFASSVLDVQEVHPQQIRSSTHSSARYNTMTRSTAETEPVSGEELREEANEEEQKRDQPNSSKLQRRHVNSDHEQERNSEDVNQDVVDFRASTSTRSLHHNTEPSDDEDEVGMTNDGEIDGSDQVRISRKRNSDHSSERHTEIHRTARPSKSSSLMSRERRTHRIPETHDKIRVSLRVPRRSRNQLEELVDNELYSDEELSDGPDTPYRRPQQQRSRHDSNRQQSWISDDSRKNLTQNSSKRLSSRLASRHVKSHSKRRSYSPESSAHSDDMNSSDYESLEEQSSDKRHRSRTAQRSQSHHSTRAHHAQPQSSRKSMHQPSSRDHHFVPAMEYPPKLSKPDIRLKRDSKSKSESRSKEGVGRPRKFPEGIVWPPGMEEECIARLGLDGHHPIAPPGLEHLVTEEQWGDYWTWLHWYSSWQMWYMKNGKKPKRKSDKDKRSDRRRADASDNEAEYYEKHAPQNANWRLDVGPDKRHRRRSRVE